MGLSRLALRQESESGSCRTQPLTGQGSALGLDVALETYGIGTGVQLRRLISIS